MEHPCDETFVATLPERCRTCYTCVRECPAKAIRIVAGQAEIIPERCIACGNCIRVCSQGAKYVRNTVEEVRTVLDSGEELCALVAPSFPAAYPDVPPETLVGMIRRLGFAHVHEVAFGADLVARAYQQLLEREQDRRFIATSCPAIVTYVCKYHPQLVNALAPIVSPMVAMARVVRQLYGAGIKVVFIGPCIAKKCETVCPNLCGEVDVANTFKGLTRLFQERKVRAESVTPSDFDPPYGNLGALFPISRGMLQAAHIEEDLVTAEVVAADGREGFLPALKEFEAGELDARLLEVLACHGCIMGPAMNVSSPLFRRRSQVSRYVRECAMKRSEADWQSAMDRFSSLDLGRGFLPRDQRIPAPPENEIVRILAEMGKTQPEDELNCGACGYDSCREHAIAIYKGLAEDKMCLPYTIEELNRTIHDLGVSNEQLARTQEALVHSEKLASMGQLAAGIAHELNNPLGVVLMYAHMMLEEAAERDPHREDLSMIAEQADRCKKIVAGLLHFARQNKVKASLKDVHLLIDGSVRGCMPPDTIHVSTEVSMLDPVVELDHDQIQQVLINLVENAIAAMPQGGDLRVSARDHPKDPRLFQIEVADTGPGIAKEMQSKIFEPFFTTKKIGKGTGLGLAVAYGIVKMHRGNLSVESNADPSSGPTGATFILSLSKRVEQEA